MTIKLRSILILIGVVACSFGAKSAPITIEACRSSTIINGMKIELYNSEPIIVIKNTNKVEKRDPYYNQSDFEYPVLNLKFTALNKDIQWQRRLYRGGIQFSYQIGENDFLALPEGEGTERQVIAPEGFWVKLETLKKGDSEIFTWTYPRVKFDKIYKKNDFEIVFKVSGELRDINSVDPSSHEINPYKGDKNIWQEAFELCLEADWQYKD